MKKTVVSIGKRIVLAAAMLMCSAAMALPVDANRAAAVAQRFWNAQGAKGSLTERPTDFAHLHLFVGAEGGFVVVGGDDCARPVLAWSADAPVGDTLHASMRYWMSGYESQIARAAASGAPTSGAWREADAYSDPLTTTVPLLNTTWNQGEYYNDSTPVDNGQHCYTGCVATATAQVMKYWNWPTTGRGSHSYYMYGEQSANFGATTYAWSQMPNVLTAVSSAAEVAAVAQLMYHIGVAVEMEYGTSSSGAFDVSSGSALPSSEHALKRYFGYSNNVRSLSRGVYSQQQWFDIIRQEIDALRPVLYSGMSVTAGHAFVCDGYDSEQRLHINWGWGGAYNGYFACDALEPSGSGIGGNAESSYSMAQGIIVGIEPDSTTYNPAAQYTVGLTATAGGTVSGAGTYTVGTFATLTATATSAYRFDHWSDGVRWNPRSLPVCGNMNLTATFVRADATDTLQWDNGAYVNLFYTNPSPFGNHLLAISRSVGFADSLMAGHQQLTAVMYFTIDTGVHAISVSYGDIGYYEKSARALYPGFWNTIYVDDTILLDTQHGVNVAVTWPKKAPVMSSNAWPIRAITDGMFRPHQLTVQGGTGSGIYATDTNVVITATPPDSNYAFLRWSDGDTNSIRTVHLTSDSTFTAEFEYLLKRVLVSTWGYYYDETGEIQARIFMDTMMYLPKGWNTIEVQSPVMGYHFTNWVWPDNYDNPRRVYIDRDTSFNSIFYPSVVYLDINVNDTAMGTTNRPSGNARRDYYFNVEAEVTHPNAYITTWTAPANYPTNPLDYVDYEGVSSIGYNFDSYDTCTWPDTVHITVNFDTNSGNTVAYFPMAGTDPYIRTCGSRSFPHQGLMRWAVKYHPSAFHGNRYIRKVKIGGLNNTRDTLRIYQGGEGAPATLLHTQVLNFAGGSSGGTQWHTIDLTAAVEIDGSSPVWVVLSSDTFVQMSDFTGQYTLYPCVQLANGYTGNPNGSLWYTSQHGWMPVRLGYDSEAADWVIDPTSSEEIKYTWAVGLITSESAVDTYTLTVVSANPSMGEVEGSGSYEEGSTATLRANPRDGYRFTHWQDGNTQNPRTVTVTQNKTYTAYFEAIPPTYTVTLVSNNEQWGTVDGGGSFESGTTIRIYAYPKTGYTFVSWSNGNTYANAYYTVTGNVTLTATFAPEETEGIGEVRQGDVRVYAGRQQIVVEGAENEVVMLYDVTGRKLASQQGDRVTFNVPEAGVYMISVGSALARRVVVAQ